MTASSITVTIAGFLLLGCSSVGLREPVSPVTPLLRPVNAPVGQSLFEGWAVYRGEIMLYDTRRSMGEKRKAPHCISGVASAGTGLTLADYDGQRVIITGKLIEFEPLPDEARALLPRKVLAGRVIHNFCFGEQVILVHKIERW